jgi:hypothetical protein
MNVLTTRSRRLILSATTLATIAGVVALPLQASAGPSDEPWPEPPSCSNDTGTCTSIEDMLAYECYFEEDDAPISFCEDPFELLEGGQGPTLVTPRPGPEPTPLRLVAPTSRR